MRPKYSGSMNASTFVMRSRWEPLQPLASLVLGYIVAVYRHWRYVPSMTRDHLREDPRSHLRNALQLCNGLLSLERPDPDEIVSDVAAIRDRIIAALEKLESPPLTLED
jgi:hypothetical protein